MAVSQRIGCDVVVVGHRGHTAASEGVYGLAAQRQHHGKVLSRLSADDAYGRLLLVGHSIGGYLALAAADFQSPAARRRICSIGLIAPTLSRFRLIRFLPIWGASRKPMRVLAQFLLPWLAAAAAATRHPRKKELHSLSGGKFLQNILHLVGEELVQLPDELPKSQLSEWSKRPNGLYAIFAADDPYVSPSTQQEFHSLLCGASASSPCRCVHGRGTSFRALSSCLISSVCDRSAFLFAWARRGFSGRFSRWFGFRSAPFSSTGQWFEKVFRSRFSRCLRHTVCHCPSDFERWGSSPEPSPPTDSSLNSLAKSHRQSTFGDQLQPSLRQRYLSALTNSATQATPASVSLTSISHSFCLHSQQVDRVASLIEIWHWETARALLGDSPAQ
eukprot:GHVT01067010.1.p1 GENE.GHVT01067010.1~~GHVT01067010.1.p1  ORF type:complete len:388 (-),score=57.52 GHVT01067010.1:1148-2311(-)